MMLHGGLELSHVSPEPPELTGTGKTVAPTRRNRPPLGRGRRGLALPPRGRPGGRPGDGAGIGKAESGYVSGVPLARDSVRGASR